jgi:hypothetical protein
LFKEIVTNHNIVIKAWAIVADELFDRIKDIVLFETDAGMINLQRYFEVSRFSKLAQEEDNGKRYIFYFTAPGGAGQYGVLFAAKGIRVIDSTQFPDESFLQKYAEKDKKVALRRLDVSGGFIFEKLEHRQRKWVDLEEAYADHRIDANVVQFIPEDIPAVLIYHETEPVSTDQVDRLLADPNLSTNLKSLVRQMWEDREKHHKSKVTGGGILYVNANNPVVQKLADFDLFDYEIQNVLIVIYNNALMLSLQGQKRAMTPENAKRVFDGNNRAIEALMNKIYEVRELRAQEFVAITDEPSSVEKTVEVGQSAQPRQEGVNQTLHTTCFVALPFTQEYEIVYEALQDVLEAAPYFWEVVRADERFFANDIPKNVAYWIARSHCYAVDLSEGNANVMMELGHIYWGYPSRPLFLLQRENTEPLHQKDLGARLRITYPWGDSPNRKRIADALREEIKKFEDIKQLHGRAHYLSALAMQAEWISSKLAQALAEQYETVEDLLNVEAEVITKEIGGQIARPGTVHDIQNYMREQCELPRSSV